MSLERRTDGLGRVGTCGLRRSSSCREQLEGLRKLQPRREAIPGTLLQLLPSVRCKLGEWREATQHMMEATHSTAKTAAGAEEHGEEGAVGGEAVDDVDEMEDTGAANEASEEEVVEAGAATVEEEARNAAAGRRVFEALVTGAANGLQLLVTVRHQPTCASMRHKPYRFALPRNLYSLTAPLRLRFRPSIRCGLLPSGCG
jgi:hypothetical protein